MTCLKSGTSGRTVGVGTGGTVGEGTGVNVAVGRDVYDGITVAGNPVSFPEVQADNPAKRRQQQIIAIL